MTTLQPPLETLQSLIQANNTANPTNPPNLYPVYCHIQADTLTPHIAYLKLARPGQPNSRSSFILESTKEGEYLDRFSFIGVNPRKIIKTGNGFGPDVDPLVLLEEELKNYNQAIVPGIPPLSGGAVGYISYDCIKYFEPKTRNDNLKNILDLPEAALMLFDTIVVFDFVFQKIQIITNILIPQNGSYNLEKLLTEAKKEINSIKDILLNDEEIPYPPQGPIKQDLDFTSNIGQEGYEDHVRVLKDHIKKGDIIQAVPSQRVARPTSLHPFNIYRHLRTVNPSPYMFYIDYLDFQIVGASPELLVKCDKGRIITHPIAGTVRRGKTRQEDDLLAQQLLSSKKDKAEHIMLVDLARNDINRVCDPMTTNVDRLLTIERFSHVMHLVSQVSGKLRTGKTRFDAFRSIFPAGTVSGAPKIRAMQLISELEKEQRGVYAGAVGHWGYNSQNMDTCIALRTMVTKNGIAYLQAGGGIVFDSDPYEEYIETLNKMKANNNTIVEAEKFWTEKLKNGESSLET